MNKILLTLTVAAATLLPMASAKSHTTTPAATAPAASTPAPTTKPATPAAPTKIIHINSAAVTDLTTIPGINPKIAADVVKNRPYKTADELVKKVKGIGPKNVKKMLPYIDFQ